MVRVCVAALFLPGTFESPESVVAALFLPSSLRSLWSPHCSYLRVSMYHNGVASSRPPGASLRIARHSILVVVLPFRSQQEEPRDESFPCHSEVSVRYRTRSSRFFPAVLGQARPPFDLGRCRCLYAVFLHPQASSRKEERSPANRESFPRSVPATVPDRPGRPGSFPLFCLLLGACTPAVRSWSVCCRAPLSREAPRESFPRSVSATVPDRPGSLPLCCLGVVVFRPQGRSPANHF